MYVRLGTLAVWLFGYWASWRARNTFAPLEMHILTEWPNICYQSCLPHTQPLRRASAFASASIRVVRCSAHSVSSGKFAHWEIISLLFVFHLPTVSLAFVLVTVCVCEWGAGGRHFPKPKKPKPKKTQPEPICCSTFHVFHFTVAPSLPQRAPGCVCECGHVCYKCWPCERGPCVRCGLLFTFFISTHIAGFVFTPNAGRLTF